MNILHADRDKYQAAHYAACRAAPPFPPSFALAAGQLGGFDQVAAELNGLKKVCILVGRTDRQVVKRGEVPLRRLAYIGFGRG